MFEAEIEKELMEFGQDILSSDQFQDAESKQHHNGTITIGLHSQHVAKTALWMCHALQKIGAKPDIKTIVVSSLCHDLSLTDRHDKYVTGWQCCQMHPIDAVYKTREIVGMVDERTENAISRHMFPLTPRPPKYIEGIILSISDKYVSTKDMVLAKMPKERLKIA